MQLGPGSGQFNPAGQQALQSNIAGQQAMANMGRGRGQSFDPQQAEMTMALAQMERDDRREDRAADRQMNMMQFAASREDANRRHQLDTMRATSDVASQKQQIDVSKEQQEQSRRDRAALERAAEALQQRREEAKRRTIEAGLRGSAFEAERSTLVADHEAELIQQEQNILRAGASLATLAQGTSEGLTNQSDRLRQMLAGRSLIDKQLEKTLGPLVQQDLKAAELALAPDNETNPMADLGRRALQALDVASEYNPFTGFQASGYSPAEAKWNAVRGGAPTSDAFLAAEYPNVVRGQVSAITRYLESVSPNDSLPDSVSRAISAYLNTFSPITGAPTDGTDDALKVVIGELNAQKIDPYAFVAGMQRLAVEYETNTFEQQKAFSGNVLVSGTSIKPGEFLRDSHLAQGVGGGAYSDAGGLQIALHNRSVMSANIARNASQVAFNPAFNGVMSNKRIEGTLAVLAEMSESPEVKFEDVLLGRADVPESWIPSEDRVRELAGIRGLTESDLEELLRQRESVAGLSDRLKEERTRFTNDTRDMERRHTSALLDLGRRQTAAEAAAQTADLAALEQLTAGMSPAEMAALVALEGGG